MPIIKKYQTPIDFSCQHCGTAEALFLLANLNGISITDEPAPGTTLLSEVVDTKVVSAFMKNELHIATSLNDNPGTGFSGIGYMQIAHDFKVS